MSTAGKVLAVLIVLASIVCLFLAGGVARLNYNANQRLQALADQLAKTQADIETTRREIAETSDRTTVTQEKIDRDITSLRSQQTDLERTRSQVIDTLERLKYDLNTVNQTIAEARTSLEHRNSEFDAEQKAMEERRQEVQHLKANNGQLMARLDSLRKQFRDTYHDNIARLHKGR
jgi:chromosome segregation ATPase